MAEELEELWKEFKFTEEEDIRTDLDGSSMKAAREVGSCCAIMKILTQTKYKPGGSEEKSKNVMETQQRSPNI